MHIDQLLEHRLGENQTAVWTTEQPPQQRPHVKDAGIGEPATIGLTTENLVSVDIILMSLKLSDVKQA